MRYNTKFIYFNKVSGNAILFNSYNNSQACYLSPEPTNILGQEELQALFLLVDAGRKHLEQCRSGLPQHDDVQNHHGSPDWSTLSYRYSVSSVVV